MEKEIKSIGIETADIYLHFPCITRDEADELDKYLKEEYIEYEGATDVVIGLQIQLKKQKEIIDKIRKEVNEQHTIMGCEVVENWVLLQILEDKEK